MANKVEAIFREAKKQINAGLYQQALENLKSLPKKIRKSPEVLHMSGFAFVQIADYPSAISALDSALQIEPKNNEIKRHLASVYLLAKAYKKAKVLFEALVKKFPQDEELLLNLSDVAIGLKDYSKAMDLTKKLLAINSKHALAYCNQGIAYSELDDEENSLNSFRQSIEIDENNVSVLISFTQALIKFNRFVDAFELISKATKNDPRNVECLVIQSKLFRRLADNEAALENHEKIIEIEPDIDWQNYLFTQNYSTSMSAKQIYENHATWGQMLARQYGKVLNQRQLSLDNKIKIAYVSADFKLHSVLFFIEPIIEQHKRDKFEVYCYSNLKREDKLTTRLKSKADVWRDVSKLEADQIVDLIVKDEIDILIDLSGYTAGNLMNVFVQKPAPIQVTYLGYPNTTGLKCIDYRISESNAEPKNADSLYSEKLVRLPNSFLCYRPPSDLEIKRCDSLPARKNGCITFGSFNHVNKINRNLISTWSEILKSVDGSHLILKNSVFSDSKVQQYYLQLFKKCGIGTSRIQFLTRINSIEKHLESYNSIDIALDTFPYNGTTTTCEALWMGVPVLSLIGDRHASRVGNSLLSQVGLVDWVADSEADYIEKANFFASDISNLEKLRNGLRGKLLSSSLCDAKLVTSDLESAYMDMIKEQN